MRDTLAGALATLKHSQNSCFSALSFHDSMSSSRAWKISAGHTLSHQYHDKGLFKFVDLEGKNES